MSTDTLKITRYGVFADNWSMEASDDGDYVTYEDHDKMTSQLAERLEEAEMIISDLVPIALRTQRACDKSQVLNYDNPFDAECADVYGKKIQTARDFLTPPTNGK